MTKLFNLDFRGTKFAVPKLSLFNLFEHQRDLFEATSYDVRSSVPLEIFEVFVNALETGGKVPVTKDNAGALSLLAKEFWLEDLLSACSALQIASAPELITALSERISKLEHRISSQRFAINVEPKESISDHDRQLESLSSIIEANSAALRTEIEDLTHSVQLLQTELETVKSKCERPSEALVARIESIELKMSETLSRITERLSGCEADLERLKLAMPAPVSAPSPSSA